MLDVIFSNNFEKRYKMFVSNVNLDENLKTVETQRQIKKNW